VKEIMNNIFAKYVRLITLTILWPFPLQTLVAQQLLWQRIVDKGYEDYASGIAIDSKDNIIVIGTTFPWTIQPPNHEDFLTVKYNSDGDTLWIRQYNLTNDDGAEGIAVDKLDNIIVTGYIVGDSTGADIHVVKYNPEGDILWTQTYSNGKREFGEFGVGIAIDSKNNIIVTGRTSYNFGDYITLKYDSSGNLIWARTYNGGWEDCAQDVAVDDSDNIVVTGYSNGNMNWDLCTIKYKPDGDTIWVRRYDVAETDRAFGVTTDRQGNVIVVGETHYFYPGSGGSTGIVIKYTQQGDKLWTKMFTDTLQYAEVEKFVDVATDDLGNIYLAGNYARWDTSGKLWIDYYITKCNPQGDTLWTYIYDYDHEDEASGIALDRYGNIFVTGTTNQSPEVYKQNYLTIKIKDINNSVEPGLSHPSKFFIYPNYPNPFNPLTIISYQLPRRSFVNLKVFDLLGREIETLVSEVQSAGIHTLRWNAARFASGVYIIRLTAGNSIASQKLLLIR
jgi:uncharacterized delta-60 repeat protein